MEKDELIRRLNGFEWKEIEFKSAQNDVPRSAYETVSAFSNTGGGSLVFGVKDDNGQFEVIGVIQIDRIQNAFLSTLRSSSKTNHIVEVQESSLEIDGKTLLVFYIPEAQRKQKPVFLDGDLRRSFLRKGGCDVRCTQEEINRFLRDAADKTYDTQVQDVNPEKCFDEKSLQWYRKRYSGLNEGRYEELSDIEFLLHWGLIVEQSDKILPTNAAILLLGNGASLRQILSRPVADIQWFHSNKEDVEPGTRWNDRLLAEDNIIISWRLILEKYAAHSEVPFSIDPQTLERNERPPDYISFREAMINVLIHQDYADNQRKPEVRFFKDRTVFWNPGDAFATDKELVEQGEKEVRNPLIVSAMRRIRLSEQAGSGMPEIFRNWQQLGNLPPVIENDKSHKTFRLKLLKEELLSEEQLLFQASLGVHLSEEEAKTFAYATKKEFLTIPEVKLLLSIPYSGAKTVLDRLETQALLVKEVEGENPVYGLAEHLKNRDFEQKTPTDLVTDQVEAKPGDLVTDQVKKEEQGEISAKKVPLKSLSDIQQKILQMCDVPRSIGDLMEHVQLKNRTHFRTNHLQPMLDGGVIKMTNPENPNASNQKYVLTETGVEIKARRKS
ncbi:RNA-binding domain-containing protein [Fibrobacterota bacterium]